MSIILKGVIIFRNATFAIIVENAWSFLNTFLDKSVVIQDHSVVSIFSNGCLPILQMLTLGGWLGVWGIMVVG